MLNEIHSPADLKKLDYDQLDQLAYELRREILQTVSRTGGHLSSNLGAVELTLALDYVLEENDRIFFDVGHQTYAQKLLTGRQELFRRLRQKDGCCGFPSVQEDPRDSFSAGHASTAVSAALGVCRARDIRGTGETVVAVVGDGALTGGMCYEALNDAGQSGTDLIVVVNDNDMSISKNVGALSRHLTAIRQTRFYRSFKTNTRSVLSRVPLVGPVLFRMIEKLRDMLKGLVIGDNIFDALGFRYTGPVDGHDIPRLVRAIRLARQAGGPVVIHVVTQKGKGFAPAEKEPDRFHGPSPFDVATGRFHSLKGETLGMEAGRLLSEMAEKDGRICAVCAAMPTGTGFATFARRWPQRFFDVGIAEEHAVTMAGGLAFSGLKPYVAIYSTFLQRAYDQISNDVCLNSLPVTFLLDRAGLVGADGATHNGLMDLSYLRSIPNMTIAAPRDIRALRRLLYWSRTYEAPLAIRYPKEVLDLGEGLDRREEICPGRWETLLEGEVTLLAVGRMVQTALMAAMALHERGISAGVVDAMFVKPMDENLLRRLAEKSSLLVTLEENTLPGGFGEGVLGELEKMGMTANVVSLGVADRYVAHASLQEQLEMCGLTPQAVAEAVEKRLAQSHERSTYGGQKAQG